MICGNRRKWGDALQSTQLEAWHLAIFCKCYQFPALLLSQSQSIAGRLKQQALYGCSDKCPWLPRKPVSHITHLQGTSVAQDPTQAVLPASSRHPLLGTPISSLGYLAAPPLLPREPGAYPLQMSATLLSYFIFLVASHSHQVGGGQRWCFIHLCNPRIRAGCGGWWTIFVDHRKEGGRKKTDTIHESGRGVAITEVSTI